jgi:hypothetical protein
MEELNVVYRLQKYLKEVIQDHKDTIMTGVDSMDKYKYLIGKVQAFEQTQQELSNLLDRKEHKDD